MLKITKTPGAGMTNVIATDDENVKYPIGGTINSPTANCQLFCCHSFNSVFRLRTIQDQRAAVKALWETTGKNIMLIDVNQAYEQKVEALFENKNDILVKEKYKSTNGSNMMIFLLKTKSMKNW